MRSKSTEPKITRKSKYISRDKLQAQQKLIPNHNRWWVEINLICSLCKRKFTVTTTQPQLYTTEIKKNIICIFCPKKGVK
jgi:hypothetical protein